MQKRVLGFTLVEMLIVIVIIGILVGAILPKIMGVTSRARDTKRVIDLRNVAMAIQRYKMDTGEYPKLKKIVNGNDIYSHRDNLGLAGSVSNLQANLGDYLKEIPKDPSKTNKVDILVDSHGAQHNSYMKNMKRLTKGEYYYQIGKKSGIEFALLVAKVETLSSANYLLLYPQVTNKPGSARYFAGHISGIGAQPITFREQSPYLCSSVYKVKKGNEQPATVDNSECKYSSEDQLYYIMKI
ncbi:MAG: hypothetical protein CR971_01975 [candidate division SR1 bacterium]|nr:MAG: hypothetical protein CR971_01975 [candidate division SR1 bacterium]